jgi:hypothetical protein
MIILEAVYSKKLGLPNYSSHQYSVSIRTEIPDIGAVEKTNREMYQLLQSAVNAEITKPGFVPESSFGVDEHSRTCLRLCSLRVPCKRQTRQQWRRLLREN